MAVVAMTREMGSLGKDVAAGLADQLGLKVVHHELVEHNLAEHLGLQESAVHRYLEGGALLLERWKIDKQKLSRTRPRKSWSWPNRATSSSVAGGRPGCCDTYPTCSECAYVPIWPFGSG